jgi:5'-3' exonuclease
MGLHAVPAFLRDKYGHLLYKEHISLFAYKRVFMDIASWIYKSVCVNGVDSSSWINTLLRLLYLFKVNKVNLVPVFDGQAPPEKLREQQERREKRAQAKLRLKALSDAIDAFRAGSKEEDSMKILTEEVDRLEKKGKVEESILLSQRQAETPKIDAQTLLQLEEVCRSLKRQTTFITEDDNKFMRDIFESCGITWIQAPEEAEAYCCWLVRNGFGHAVISCDSDCIAHRADIYINKLDASTGMITYLNLCECMEEWQLTEEQIVDFAILVGCDYNPGSRKNKIGPTKAIDLLRKHKCIENMTLNDKECLQIEHCRRLFNPVYPTDTVLIKAGSPDLEKMNQLWKLRPDLDQDLCMKLIQVMNKKPKMVVLSN